MVPPQLAQKRWVGVGGGASGWPHDSQKRPGRTDRPQAEHPMRPPTVAGAAGAAARAGAIEEIGGFID